MKQKTSIAAKTASAVVPLGVKYGLLRSGKNKKKSFQRQEFNERFIAWAAVLIGAVLVFLFWLLIMS